MVALGHPGGYYERDDGPPVRRLPRPSEQGGFSEVRLAVDRTVRLGQRGHALKKLRKRLQRQSVLPSSQSSTEKIRVLSSLGEESGVGRGSRSLGVAARGLVGAVDIGSWEGGLDSWGEGGEDEERGKRPAAAAARGGGKAERRHGSGTRAHVLRHR